MNAQDKERAIEYFQRAYQLQMRGALDEAIAHYEKSIQLFPTAEAYTFLGWTHSFRKNYKEAIRLCLKAIEIDPTFGNPYNDIGAYLIEQGKLEEAIPWLEKATRASRYECYFFAWYNLGRIYEAKWDWAKARECYERAIQENPDYRLAKEALEMLTALMN